ncbi:hypothetical protein [Psychromicrobium sp. YIM B11713]|uniref:hypothetical protein n=1 Tax=Psychromicrobium sp. YIM B11713 TaxID=3145233 RepID=UPI00374ED569
MNEEIKEFRISVLLFMQRALLDAVTPGLRGVSVGIGLKKITALFIYEATPTLDELELISFSETQIVADFDESVSISFDIKVIPASKDRIISIGNEWVYLRHERTPNL